MNRDFASRIPFILAVALTMAWAAVVALYARGLGWGGFMSLAPVELTALLATASGPPVVLWLIVMVDGQRRTLTQLIAQSRQSLGQAESQTRALLQLQMAVSQSASAGARDLALHDLAANAAVLAERLGVITKEAAPAAWARYGAGDITVFVQSFLSFARSHPDMAERMADAVGRDTLARAALAGFVRRYQRFTHGLGDDKMALEVVDEGALGRAFRLFKQADDLAAEAAVAQSEPAV